MTREPRGCTIEQTEMVRTLRRRLGLVLGWLELPSDLEVCCDPESVLFTLGRWLESLEGVREVSCYLKADAALRCVRSSAQARDVSIYQGDSPLVRCAAEGTITLRNEGTTEIVRSLGNGEARGVVHLTMVDGDVETSCLVDHALAVAALALRGTHPPEADHDRRLRQLASMGRVLGMAVFEASIGLPAMLSRLKALQLGPHATDLPTGEINTLTAQLRRVSDILNHALQVTRPCEDGFTEVDLSRTIAAVVALVSHYYRAYGVLITLELVDSDVTVTGSSCALQQVWLNLLSNAFDAIRTKAAGKGHIIVRLEHDSVRKQAELTFTDDGSGMTPEVLAKVQENTEFFSTRPEGLGLGVVESRRIVSEHGGTLTYVSSAGKGTTAIVRLQTA